MNPSTSTNQNGAATSIQGTGGETTATHSNGGVASSGLGPQGTPRDPKDWDSIPKTGKIRPKCPPHFNALPWDCPGTQEFHAKLRRWRALQRGLRCERALTEPPATMTYASVVSRESVRIIFTLAALNGLNVLSANISNAYLI